jgi:hypothetical protein
MLRHRLLLALLLVLLPSVSRAGIITFDGLTGNTGDLLAPYAEGGFLVTPLTGRWMEMTTSSPTPGVVGNPAPSIWEDTFLASLEVTELSGRLFSFASIDLFGATADYTFEGLLGGSTVFSASVDVPSSSGFVTIPSPSLALIDTLRISVVRDQAEYSNVDNINVNAVPEPSTLLILLGGSLVLSLASLRRSS